MKASIDSVIALDSNSEEETRTLWFCSLERKNVVRMSFFKRPKLNDLDSYQLVGTDYLAIVACSAGLWRASELLDDRDIPLSLIQQAVMVLLTLILTWKQTFLQMDAFMTPNSILSILFLFLRLSLFYFACMFAPSVFSSINSTLMIFFTFTLAIRVIVIIEYVILAIHHFEMRTYLFLTHLSMVIPCVGYTVTCVINQPFTQQIVWTTTLVFELVMEYVLPIIFDRFSLKVPKNKRPIFSFHFIMTLIAIGIIIQFPFSPNLLTMNYRAFTDGFVISVCALAILIVWCQFSLFIKTDQDHWTWSTLKDSVLSLFCLFNGRLLFGLVMDLIEWTFGSNLPYSTENGISMYPNALKFILSNDWDSGTSLLSSVPVVSKLSIFSTSLVLFVAFTTQHDGFLGFLFRIIMLSGLLVVGWLPWDAILLIKLSLIACLMLVNAIMSLFIF
jgi:hypothetical protein